MAAGNVDDCESRMGYHGSSGAPHAEPIGTAMRQTFLRQGCEALYRAVRAVSE